MTTAPKKPVVSEAVLVKQRQEGISLIAPLKSKVTAMVVKTAADYEAASAVLSKVREARQEWKERNSKATESLREAMAAQKKALAAYTEVFSFVDGPLYDLEEAVKSRMKAFKLEEARLIREAEEAKEKERQELQRQLEEKERAEAKAKTPAMAARILESKAKLHDALAKTREKGPVPIKAAGSVARTQRKWRLKEGPHSFQQFLIHLLNNVGVEGLSLIQIDEVQMNAYFKLHEPTVGEWMPGIEVYDDITIAGR